MFISVSGQVRRPLLRRVSAQSLVLCFGSHWGEISLTTSWILSRGETLQDLSGHTQLQRDRQQGLDWNYSDKKPFLANAIGMSAPQQQAFISLCRGTGVSPPARAEASRRLPAACEAPWQAFLAYAPSLCLSLKQSGTELAAKQHKTFPFFGAWAICLCGLPSPYEPRDLEK